MLVRATAILFLTGSLLTHGAEPLTRQALIKIANTDKPAAKPSIPERDETKTKVPPRSFIPAHTACVSWKPLSNGSRHGSIKEVSRSMR